MSTSTARAATLSQTQREILGKLQTKHFIQIHDFGHRAFLFAGKGIVTKTNLGPFSWATFRVLKRRGLIAPFCPAGDCWDITEKGRRLMELGYRQRVLAEGPDDA